MSYYINCASTSGSRKLPKTWISKTRTGSKTLQFRCSQLIYFGVEHHALNIWKNVSRLLICISSRTTDKRWLNPWFFAAQIQIPIPNKYLGFGYKGLVFCRNNSWLMKNMDKGLTVPKWVLINRRKVPQMYQNLSAQIVCPSPKVWYFYEKKASLGVRSPCSISLSLSFLLLYIKYKWTSLVV